MEKNKTQIIFLLFGLILLLDIFVFYIMFSKKPTPYIITQQANTPLKMSDTSGVTVAQDLTSFYYYQQSPTSIKFYKNGNGLVLEKQGNYTVLSQYDSLNSYLLSSGNSLFVADLDKKTMDEIITTSSPITSAYFSPDHKFINYTMNVAEKNVKGKTTKLSGQIWQYDLVEKTSRMISSTDLSAGSSIKVLNWLY